MNDVELIGFFAGICVLLSFLTSNIKKVRMINMVGCLLFVVYGFISSAWSVMFINGCLFVIHIYKLCKGDNKDD